jgi:hypothetical protein
MRGAALCAVTCVRNRALRDYGAIVTRVPIGV